MPNRVGDSCSVRQFHGFWRCMFVSLRARGHGGVWLNHGKSERPWSCRRACPYHGIFGRCVTSMSWTVSPGTASTKMCGRGEVPFGRGLTCIVRAVVGVCSNLSAAGRNRVFGGSTSVVKYSGFGRSLSLRISGFIGDCRPC